MGKQKGRIISSVEHLQRDKPNITFDYAAKNLALNSLCAAATIVFDFRWRTEASEGRVLLRTVRGAIACQMDDALLILLVDDLARLNERLLDIYSSLGGSLQEEQAMLIRKSLSFFSADRSLVLQIA